MERIGTYNFSTHLQQSFERTYRNVIGTYRNVQLCSTLCKRCGSGSAERIGTYNIWTHLQQSFDRTYRNVIRTYRNVYRSTLCKNCGRGRLEHLIVLRTVVLCGTAAYCGVPGTTSTYSGDNHCNIRDLPDPQARGIPREISDHCRSL